jgi:hypothetical protein
MLQKADVQRQEYNFHWQLPLAIILIILTSTYTHANKTCTL